MNEARNPSTVMVNVVDNSELIKIATEEIQKKNPNQEAIIHTSFGYVKTPKGLFVLCTEGVGSSKPITEKNTYMVEVHSRKVQKEGEKENIFEGGMFPVLSFNLSDKSILSMPVIKQVALHEFIRSFGGRLESNFLSWENHFKKVGVKNT